MAGVKVRDGIGLVKELFSLSLLEPSLGGSQRTEARLASPNGQPGDSDTTTTGLVKDRSFSQDPAQKLSDQVGSLSRWSKWELYFYVFMFIIVVPMMFWTGFSVSVETHPNYQRYAHLLEPGWLFGRKVDNSDSQYSGFRDNFLILSILLLVHPNLRRLLMAWKEINVERFARNRVWFDVLFGIGFLASLHGVGLLSILFLSSVNYAIAKRFGYSKWNVILTWVFNITILFLNDQWAHYQTEMFDNYSGMLPRWDVHFKITTLRLISFNMDFYWAKKSTITNEKKEGLEIDHTDINRIEKPAVELDYNYLNYLAYILYAPLYLAGPVITFNNYVSQLYFPSRNLSSRRTLLYGIRLGISVLTMELILHFIYVVAISQTKAWENDTPFQLCMISYFNLHIIWLKLLIPWRFFRLWAMYDGIESPENMLRCMTNNYSALGFWRAWHRSFNRWIVRYIYIPLGGNKRPIFNMLIVFTFVAFWHDISLRLLIWGWMITIFVLPEVLARFLMPPDKWSDRWFYRHICAMAATANALLMICANLVGFCIGLDGLRDLVTTLFGAYQGYLFILATLLCMFIGIQFMFEIRAIERSNGINLRC